MQVGINMVGFGKGHMVKTISGAFTSYRFTSWQ